MLNFFLFSCLDVKKIKIIVLTNAEIDDYHKEQKKNEEAIIAKQKKDEENREKNDLLQKIIKHNSANFKGLMSTISEAITNQNDPRHIIEAEIIKIESKINKTGKTIFVITISDYEECVIIKTMNTADVPDTN
ncbi:hypothetical protein FACS189496_4020 [Bacilli bacterium]|nr:hypothetical protein FACS189496_4020 [Bacilli bacterium]